MTDDLVQFIRARLDEDERAAQRADPGSWTLRTLGRHDLAAVKTESGLMQLDGSRATANAVHIARHDPARVLREVEAKRLLLEQAVTSRHLVTGDQFMDCPLVTEADADHVERIQALNDMYREELGREPSCIETCGRDARVRRTLELLAMPYSDDPGYTQALAANRA
ncbi:DUF6221 family protein [Streptomyces sp. NPDC005780]|uniref:DUF6221 family protein n=1 Tax=Streptomyces sp. NPDC005780 TaxID=3364730 RepID=UPI0036AB08C2